MCMTLAEDRVIKEYLDHGFRRVVVRRDEPNFFYPLHFHAYNLVFQVMEGMMDVKVNHKHFFARPGDHIHVNAGQYHAVQIGPEGCVYIHAEKEAGHKRAKK